MSGSAGRAAVAGDNGVYDYLVADGECLCLPADLPNNTPKFVPDDGRVGDPRVEFATIDVQIGATNARVAGFYQDLIRSDLRIRRLTHPDVSIVVKNACFHATNPVRPCRD